MQKRFVYTFEPLRENTRSPHLLQWMLRTNGYGILEYKWTDDGKLNSIIITDTEIKEDVVKVDGIEYFKKVV